MREPARSALTPARSRKRERVWTLVLMLALSGCQRWQRFAPEGAGFAVELPGAPDEVPSNLAQPGLRARTWAAEGPGGARYQVGYLDFAPLPEADFNKVQAEWAKELAHPVAATGQGVARRVEVGNQAWVEDELTSAPPAPPLHFTSRTALLGRRRVWLSVTATRAEDAAEGQARFFGSFAPGP